MAAEWYFRVMGAEFGPVSAAELVENAADGRISPDTEVRRETEPGYRRQELRVCSTEPPKAREFPSRQPCLRPFPTKMPACSFPHRYPSTPSSSKFEVIETAEDDRFQVEILAYSSLGWFSTVLIRIFFWCKNLQIYKGGVALGSGS